MLLNWIEKTLASEIVKGQIRHGITALGMYFVTHGVMTTANAATIQDWLFSQQTAGVMTVLFGAIWSALHKRKVANATITVPPSSAPTVVKGAQLLTGVIGIFVAIMLLAPSTQAQSTNTTPTITLPAISIGSVSIPTNVAPVVNDILSWIEPYIPSITNRAITVDAIANYHKQAGFTLAAEYNINPNVAIGIGPELIDNQWHIAFGTGKLGTDVNWPVIGKMHVALVSGAVAKVNGWSLGSETMTMFFKSFDIWHSKVKPVDGFVLDLEGGPGYNSFYSGVIGRFGARFDLNFN
jgi:hypothetical protein